MAYNIVTTPTDSRRTMQVISSIHLQEEPDGGALVIDDRTLTVARINKAAYVLFQALLQPRTQEDLITILAEAANCDVSDAAAPVARLVNELGNLGWIEFQDNVADTGTLYPVTSLGSTTQ